MKFTTKIQGQPCTCEVLHYRPAVPPKLTGTFEDAEEGEDEEFEFRIFDRKGKESPELKTIASDDDIDRLVDEYQATIAELKYDF